MVIGIALAYFSQLTGCATIIVYAVYILERTGTTLDPFRSSIALAAVLILGIFDAVFPVLLLLSKFDTKYSLFLTVVIYIFN